MLQKVVYIDNPGCQNELKLLKKTLKYPESEFCFSRFPKKAHQSSQISEGRRRIFLTILISLFTYDSYRVSKSWVTFWHPLNYGPSWRILISFVVVKVEGLRFFLMYNTNGHLVLVPPYLGAQKEVNISYIYCTEWASEWPVKTERMRGHGQGLSRVDVQGLCGNWNLWNLHFLRKINSWEGKILWEKFMTTQFSEKVGNQFDQSIYRVHFASLGMGVPRSGTLEYYTSKKI